jgi:galactokinase
VVEGYALVCGTNQGIYARARQHPNSLILISSLNDGTRREFSCPMDVQQLKDNAAKGEFFSYACGVAYEIATKYKVRGVIIDNYKTDLPIAKGLSSSAAITVLVARAFNRLYDLKLTIQGEMDIAYHGEVSFPLFRALF